MSANPGKNLPAMRDLFREIISVPSEIGALDSIHGQFDFSLQDKTNLPFMSMLWQNGFFTKFDKMMMMMW
jgi:hypothetical protein